MRPQVVVTRPREEAEELAQRLDGLGYEALIEPMMTIVPLDAPLPAPRDYAALAFTSANAVRIFAARAPERDLPVYAVGGRTAQALRDAGFADIRDAGGDAAALAALIRSSSLPGGSVLHLSGRAVARDLNTLLAPDGIKVDRCAIYDAQPSARISARLEEALYARTFDHVLFFSPRTASIFETLINQAGLAQMVTSVTAFCLSAEVAASAAALPWKRIGVAVRPNSASVLALLPIIDRTIPHGR